MNFRPDIISVDNNPRNILNWFLAETEILIAQAQDWSLEELYLKKYEMDIQFIIAKYNIKQHYRNRYKKQKPFRDKELEEIYPELTAQIINNLYLIDKILDQRSKLQSGNLLEAIYSFIEIKPSYHGIGFDVKKFLEWFRNKQNIS